MASTLRLSVTAILESLILRLLRCRSRANRRVALVIAEVQVVRSAPPARTNMAICSSQRLRGEVDNQEVIQARRWHVRKVGLLLREIVLHDDILRLSPPQHVAIALDLAPVKLCLTRSVSPDGSSS